MGLDGYSAERGTTFNPVHDALLQRRAEELQRTKYRAVRLVFVYDYDPVAQTVDVVLADDRRSQPIRTVPIAGAGGLGIRIIRAWKGILETDKPDIGFLVFPRIGGGRRFLDFIRRDTKNLYAHIEETAIFCGGIPAAIDAGETPTANVVTGTPLLHQIGKRDNGVVNAAGAGFMVKENNKVVVRGEEIYFLGMNQTEANAQPVARQGDAGDGLGGSIAGGSTKVFSG